MDAASQIQRLIQRDRRIHCVALLMSFLFMALAAIGLDELGTPDLYQTILAFAVTVPFLVLAFWYVGTLKNWVRSFGCRMQLSESKFETFVENMGLLSACDKNASALTNTLQNRVIVPWIPQVRRICWVRKLIILMLVCIQLICLTVIGFTFFSQSHLKQTVIVVPQNSTVIASTDTQQTSSTMDQLAHDLLQMRDQLDAITEQVSDDQLQQVISLVNETWQGINVRLDSMPANDQSQFGQLESARSLPITKGQSIKSASARKTLRDALTKDINTLASQGARFDGPGMISQGQSNVPDTSAAKGAQGRYDELVDRGNSSTALPVNRRMEQVPPSLRKAITRYLAGQTDAQKKAHKGVEP